MLLAARSDAGSACRPCSSLIRLVDWHAGTVCRRQAGKSGQRQMGVYWCSSGWAVGMACRHQVVSLCAPWQQLHRERTTGCSCKKDSAGPAPAAATSQQTTAAVESRCGTCRQRLPDGLAQHQVLRGHLARPSHSCAAPCGECRQPGTAGSARSSWWGCWAPRLQGDTSQRCCCRLGTHKLSGGPAFLHSTPAAARYREPRCSPATSLKASEGLCSSLNKWTGLHADLLSGTGVPACTALPNSPEMWCCLRCLLWPGRSLPSWSFHSSASQRRQAHLCRVSPGRRACSAPARLQHGWCAGLPGSCPTRHAAWPSSRACQADTSAGIKW